MSQIARESGIAVGQIYRDFDSKEAIIVALSDESLHEWLQEEALDRAIQTGDESAITAWLMRQLMDECDFEKRRMLIEIMAEAGRSPIIAALNLKILTRFRTVVERALMSLAPHLTTAERTGIMDLMQVMRWGMAIGMELDPAMDQSAMRNYAARIVRREIGIS